MECSYLSLIAGPNGNITSSFPKELDPIVYDPFTQMTKSITVSGSPTHTVNFQYTADNERILKSEKQGTTNNSNLYIRGASEYPVIEKINTNNTLNDKIYIYGPTGLIAFKDATATYFLIKDHLGSTRVLFKSTGSQYTTYDYSPFGSIMRAAINGDVVYKFTGQEFDSETGLYNFRARLYDDELGIFYAVDPSGQNFSPFAYTGNNPVVYVDKDGRFFWLPILIGAVVGGYAGYKIGEAKDLHGWALFAYTFTGAAIGGLSGGFGAEVGYAAGGGFLGGALGGSTGGLISGFGMGTLAGYQGDALFDITWKSAFAGFMGGGLGGGISGLPGALIGGGTAGGVGTLLSGGNTDDILRNIFLGAAIAGLSYEIQDYFRQTGDPVFDNEENRKAMWEAAKSSFESGLEEGGWLRSNNITERFPTGTRSGINPTPRPSDATGIFHTHPNEGIGWVQEHSPADISFTNNVARVNHFVIARQNIYLYIPNQPPVSIIGSTNWYLMPYLYNIYYYGR